MTDKKKADQKASPKINPETKLYRMLGVILNEGPINRFQAAVHGDSVLNTTASILQNQYGIRVDRRTIKVPNRFSDKPTICCEYWIAPDQREKALELLGRG